MLRCITLRYFKAIQIAPTLADDDDNSTGVIYPNVTFRLSIGNRNTSTLVTISSPSVARIAQSSPLNTPVLYAILMGKEISLSSTHNQSQVKI